MLQHVLKPVSVKSRQVNKELAINSKKSSITAKERKPKSNLFGNKIK
ncbi:hypothetical protein [Undibacterium sp. RuTC16W]